MFITECTWPYILIHINRKSVVYYTMTIYQRVCKDNYAYEHVTRLATECATFFFLHDNVMLGKPRTQVLLSPREN